ncbi:hypothetical protein AaE_008168, partial [Aphanomyces astaci]
MADPVKREPIASSVPRTSTTPATVIASRSYPQQVPSSQEPARKKKATNQSSSHESPRPSSQPIAATLEMSPKSQCSNSSSTDEGAAATATLDDDHDMNDDEEQIDVDYYSSTSENEFDDDDMGVDDDEDEEDIELDQLSLQNGKSCSVEGCTRGAKRGGVCIAHGGGRR